MKALCLYFSGTGNTEFVGRHITKILEEKGHVCKLYSIEEVYPENIISYDLVYLGFPVYACIAPSIMINFINKLPDNLNRQPWYIFATKGIYSGNAIYDISKQLIKKGARIIGGTSINFPGTDGLAFISKSSKMVTKIESTDYTKRLNDIDFIKDTENNYKPQFKFWGIIIGGLFKIVYKPLESKLKKKFWADDRCIGCRKCENNCPVQNIKVSGKKVIYSNKCILCMRCIHSCPTEAIQIGNKTINKYRWHGFK